jgi:hypothetical protein
VQAVPPLSTWGSPRSKYVSLRHRRPFLYFFLSTHRRIHAYGVSASP